MKSSVYFVVPYFGKLPNHFQLWLNSCGSNIDFNWLIVTDNELKTYNIPSNVDVEISDLASVRKIFQSNFDFKIELNSPYKLCDFKPLNWMILDYYGIEYDFWGYCDIDLIFGNLSRFLSVERLRKYDRIYSEGHLSVMRNDTAINNTYELSGGYDFKDVFKNENNLGFDEHYGVNKKWKSNKLNYYFNKKEIIDIDPHFKKFRFTYITLNRRKQFFFLENNSVFRGVINNKGMIVKDEFAYIHFQKRKMEVQTIPDSVNKILISDLGFLEFPKTITDLKSIISKQPSTSLLDIRKWKKLYRFYKNNFIDGI